MPALFPVVNLFPLQNFRGLSYETNPKDGMILGIVIGGIIVFAILIHIIRNGISSPVTGKGKTSVTPRKFNFFTLQRIASTYGLDREQAKLLEYVFRNDSVSDPERVLSNPVLLDRHFKRAYKSIERTSESDEDAQRRLVSLFSLRNVIESSPGSGDTTPGQIAANTPAILLIDNESYPVKVLLSRSQNVVTEIPRNALGTPARVSKGSRVTLSFFTKSSKGFSFDGHIMGTVNTDQGMGLQISHTGKIKPLVKRKYRRRPTSIRCEFFLVFIEESGAGRKKAPKMVVDKKRFTGNVLDISIGGCSVKTSAPIQIGSRLKIGIDYDDNHVINVLGQVLRSNRSGAVGTIVHIKFLKVPRRAFNSISALVFGYDED